MSGSAIGALLGLILALIGAGFLHALSRRVELSETKLVLKVSGAAQIVVLPVLGWFAGSLFGGE
ncbi:hypothetical protein [Aquamicrobium zhengzhouense]|uniref:Uncharacterized protein n=1 Tax=Aquamicrobium zhengzhouense TaxID=2781738 RepID=A0ABS0SBH4_9HYPH|nr:hypothetical protein [Aquamicrobium zhengzhouense]MBI1620616.1 hypothetical protein [Aquamicrobium zhengzhouense]